MRREPINGPWTLTYRQRGRRRRIAGTVPGSAAIDLMREGVLPDLYVGANALAARQWEHADFLYETSFASPVLAPKQRALLVFEGVDTAAEVVLNGERVAVLENMFVPHALDVTERLARPGRNELSVVIHSALAHGARLAERWGLDGAEYSQHPESLYLRKAQHMYGWDIAPRLLFGGIWRPVFLEVHGASEIVREDCYFYTLTVDRAAGQALLGFQWRVRLDEGTDWSDYRLRVTGRCGDSAFERAFDLSFTHGKEQVPVPNAKLWWPYGYGDPSLYDVTLELLHRGRKVDEAATRIGLRTVELDFHADETDPERSRFAFLVNGERVFARGSNWVPADALHAADAARIPEILPLFTDTHCNIVRCWGGGVYENHDFFDLCDERGLLVWQDFMLACAFYPQNEHFQRVMREEAEIIIRRLRNHPSLALWAGDNEVDSSLFWSRRGCFLPSQNTLSREVLKDAVYRLDPYRPYLPSSPYIPDAAFLGRGESATPEQHLWGPRGYFKDAFYSANNAVFASEIGYHGMPARKSMERFLSPEKVWGAYNNDEWIVHAADHTGRPDGPMGQRNLLMLNQVRHLFGDSVDISNLDEFILASQITQAEAKKYFIELFRSGKPRRSGIIWWNMIDGWPQFSDAVVDYYFERKLAYGYIRCSQQPVCLMVAERGPAREVVAVNDTLARVEGEWWAIDCASEERLASGPLAIEPNGKAELGALPPSDGMRFVRLEWTANGEPSSNHYVDGLAPWDFPRYRDSMQAFRP